MVHQVSLKLGNSELILETGRMAKQANGAVLAKYGGSVVLATVCCSEQEVEGLDYVPLQVEYNEKYYAAGKIPGGFLKREGRPRDKEVLVSRLIDRPMRPLFSKAFKRDIQIVPTTISTDMVNPPDIIGMVAASAAVVISDIPFDGPIGAVRVAYLNGAYIINPTFPEIEESTLEIVVAGTEAGITMVEGGANEVSEEILLEAIEQARGPISQICHALKELQGAAGKQKIEISSEPPTLAQAEAVKSYAYSKLETACFLKGKEIRHKAIRSVKNETYENFKESVPDEDKGLLAALFEDMEYEIMRKSVLEKKVRTDGRGPEDIRPIACEIDVLPRTHGSALFTRGETQALAITTLGTVFDEQIMDDIDGEKRYDNFMLHYNFPPFSVGETGRLGTGRREIGHGHLAKRAIAGVLPAKNDFPYTIRVVSEVLESNGSSSMATVCSSTMSLLNAGVPLKKPVAGIAMGLVTDNVNTVVLSDILGEEDHLGDMDFKVAGTENGITGFQMDIKISGVSAEIMKTALEQARKGRLHILEIMNRTIGAASSTLSEYAPKIINFKVDTDKIGMIIGPGGKNIKAISEKNDVNINIENDGQVTIYGKIQKSAEDAEVMIKALIEEPEVGKIYNGTVKKITDFGAFIEILPGKEGLCHISKLSRQRVNKVEDVLSMDQAVQVKLMEIDKMGRLNLSYVDALPHGEGESRQTHGEPSHREPPQPRWRKD